MTVVNTYKLDVILFHRTSTWESGQSGWSVAYKECVAWPLTERLFHFIIALHLPPGSKLLHSSFLSPSGE